MTESHSDVPVLRTERLILREHRTEDLDAYHALWADTEVVRHLTGVALTREDAWTRIVQHRGMWRLLGFGYWILEDRATGRLVGQAGVQDRRRDIQPSLDGMLEAGWMLTSEMQGQGLAREAMEAVIQWSNAAFPEATLTCIINTDNARSLRLAEKLKFREIAQTTYKSKPTIILSRP